MSNVDKRKVSTDALETLGTILTRDEKRDAIHLAVLPIIAGEDLKRGQFITAKNGQALRDSKGLGIVDPFLSRGPKKGEKFWMILKPRIITSLRHVWSHPEFEEETVESKEEISLKSKKRLSKDWLLNFCRHSDCPDYETVIDKAQYSDGDDYIHFDGIDAHGNIPSEFWYHLEVVTGTKIKNPPQYFSCSC